MSVWLTTSVLLRILLQYTSAENTTHEAPPLTEGTVKSTAAVTTTVATTTAVTTTAATTAGITSTAATLPQSQGNIESTTTTATATVGGQPTTTKTGNQSNSSGGNKNGERKSVIPSEYEYFDELHIKPTQHKYHFVVHLCYASKLFATGIYFQPRYVLAPYKKLEYYHDLDVLVVGWNNTDFNNENLIRRVVNVKFFPNDDSCDFDLSLIEIETPFRTSSVFWAVKFMGKEKPKPGTECEVVHMQQGKFSVAEALVEDWDKTNCSQTIFHTTCNEETFLCLSSEVSVEVDITGGPILCDGKLVGAVPGMFIQQLMAIQYLPHYGKWIFGNSDNMVRHEFDGCSCIFGGGSIFIVFIIELNVIFFNINRYMRI